ncbi:MAG: ribonuclease H-like YkuK family protein [Candidatus Kerfeldbacteria bacterium]|nr:ribonuclease H-like YkuK family protein [Candidatus Kerfeldbacteria bacterium]
MPLHPALWQPRFLSPTHGRITLSRMVELMGEFLRLQPQAAYRLLIGTDSLAGRGETTMLVSAVVLHRQGNGGIYFVLKQRFQHLATLQLRMYQEAQTSINVARHLLEDPGISALLINDIEIHVDIGHRGPTRLLIQEIVGMVRANGFPVRTKPDAVAASKVADRYTTPQ